MTEDAFSLFTKPLRREIERLGWEKPTEIQKLAIPLILSGSNALLIAPTGTGKTEAAVFPIFEQLLRLRSEGEPKGICFLYITPLRALNRDILRRLTEIGEHLDFNVQVRHGDTAPSARRMQALKPPNMLITTPETLQAILPGRRMREHLRNIRWVIVDEVHEIATDKRGTQLSVGLERLREITGRDFQRVGISATIGSPELIASFLVGEGRTMEVVKAVESKDIEVRVESPTATPEDAKTAKELMISAGSIGRIRRIFELMEGKKSTIIFTNTREHAEALSSRMRLLKPEVEVSVHHGSLSRDVRVETERMLKEGELRGVVCTSSLELGIDIGSIDYMIQYMSPRQATRLVQRIGRGGHILGAVSRGVIIATMPDDVLEAAVISKFVLQDKLELPKIYDNALDVSAHQIAGLTLEYGRVRIEDAIRIIKRAWPYRALDTDEFLEVVKQLEREGVVRVKGDLIIKRLPRNFSYYYTNLSTIPNVKRFDVLDFISNVRVGTLDQEFIAKCGEPGQEFIMRGQTWRILNIDEERGSIQVEPVHQSLGAIPSWEGEIIPVTFDVAQEVGRLRALIAEEETEEKALEVLKSYPMDEEAAKKAVEMIRKQLEEGYPVPTDRLVLIECFENYAVIHACLGNLINEALARVLASLISARLGISVATQYDPYRIALILPIIVKADMVQREFDQLKPGDVQSILTNTLSETFLFAWHLWNVAKRFGVVEHDAEYKSSRARGIVRALQDTPVFKETLREIFFEKMDVEGAEKFLRMIENAEVRVKVAQRSKGYSPLALPILDRIAPQDVLRPAVPREEIIPIIKERLYSEDVRLVCLFNADWQGLRKVRSLPEKIRCPKCGSSLIATTFRSDDELIKIAKKKMAKQRLLSDEEKRWLTAWRSASLVQTYGRLAVFAMAGRGVGPYTATRILRKPFRSEDDFTLEVLKAEREYARTRLFWDS